MAVWLIIDRVARLDRLVATCQTEWIAEDFGDDGFRRQVVFKLEDDNERSLVAYLYTWGVNRFELIHPGSGQTRVWRGLNVPRLGAWFNSACRGIPPLFDLIVGDRRS